MGRRDLVDALRKGEIQFCYYIPGGVGCHGEGKPVPPDIDVGAVLQFDGNRADLGYDPDSFVVVDDKRLANADLVKAATAAPRPVRASASGAPHRAQAACVGAPPCHRDTAA